MTAAEIVRTDNISDEIPLGAEVDVLDDEQRQAIGLAVALLHRRNVVLTGGQARVVQICSSAVKMVSYATSERLYHIVYYRSDYTILYIVKMVSYVTACCVLGIGTPRYWQKQDIHAGLSSSAGHERSSRKQYRNAAGE